MLSGTTAGLRGVKEFMEEAAKKRKKMNINLIKIPRLLGKMLQQYLEISTVEN